MLNEYLQFDPVAVVQAFQARGQVSFGKRETQPKCDRGEYYRRWWDSLTPDRREAYKVKSRIWQKEHRDQHLQNMRNWIARRTPEQKAIMRERTRLCMRRLREQRKNPTFTPPDNNRAQQRKV